jgi:hypothetical protein
LDSKPDIREILEKARAVTRRLSELVREGADKKSLREDAHLFLKLVVQLSNIIKMHGGTPSAALRTHMVKLTNSTEEFAIFLHVSSFSAAQTPRPYSPMTSLLTQTPDDGKLGFVTGISRSRSAQAAVTRAQISNAPDPPRSALPLQTFKLPVIQRLRVDKNELG